MITPTQAAQSTAFNEGIPAMDKARLEGTLCDGYLRWLASPSQAATFITKKTGRESLWPGNPTWAPVERSGAVIIPEAAGHPVCTTQDPTGAACDWYDLTLAAVNVVLSGTGKDDLPFWMEHLPLMRSRADRPLVDQWVVIEKWVLRRS